jgi:hypothetical protein
MENNEFSEKLIAAYRANWLETMAQLVVLKTQLDIVTDKLTASSKLVEEYQKQIQIEAAKARPAQQAPKQEQK